MKSKRTCPNCGARGVKIVYGMADYELFLKAENKKFHIGGCCIMEDDPEWHCNNCNHEWELSKEAKA